MFNFFLNQKKIDLLLIIKLINLSPDSWIILGRTTCPSIEGLLLIKPIIKPQIKMYGKTIDIHNNI